MIDFDNLLGEVTKKGEAKVLGALMKCVDKNGKEIYSKIAGYDSLSPEAQPLREDAVFKVASATKLIASIALLQCVEQGHIGLDEPLSGIAPELDTLEILQYVDGPKATSHPPRSKITPRHLLSHTSGFGYRFLNPLLEKWVTESGAYKGPSNFVTDKFTTPLLFEPGEGWQYGSSLDWAGVVVRRIHNTSLEEYLIEHIWKPLGRSAPFPTFHVSKHPEYKARLLQSVARTPNGGLQPTEFNFGDNPDDEEGGSGLALAVGDYAAVLADLISEKPKLLSAKTISKMLEPQLLPNSPSFQMLIDLKPAWDIVAGPVRNEDVNHGLGGVVLQGDVPEIGQPKGILAWGGSSNIVWWISREKGVAGIFATQLQPFGDPVVKELVNAWKKDFWSKLN